MKNRTMAILLFFVLVLSIICGCAGNHKGPEKADGGGNTVQPKGNTVVLNERQRRILRENGLPEEYDRLTISQKNAIVKIEGALAYLEETYDAGFEYEGYVSGGLDGQYVTAEIAGSLPVRYVNVYITYKNDHYEYSDNYREIMAEPEYEEQVSEFLSGYFNPSDFQVYVEIIELNEVGDSIVERAVGRPQIIINGIYSEREVKEAAQAYAEWIAGMEHKRTGGADFRVYRTEEYSKINQVNYKKYFGKDLLRLRVSVNSDKTIDIKERDQ